jgi:hypothetical protein
MKKHNAPSEPKETIVELNTNKYSDNEFLPIKKGTKCKVLMTKSNLLQADTFFAIIDGHIIKLTHKDIKSI